MMKEYEYLFAMSLQQKLKHRIVGRIYVTVDPYDELIVKIKNDEVEFKAYVTNFSEKFYNGLTTDYEAYEITRQYRSFINKKYFY